MRARSPARDDAVSIAGQLPRHPTFQNCLKIFAVLCRKAGAHMQPVIACAARLGWRWRCVDVNFEAFLRMRCAPVTMSCETPRSPQNQSDSDTLSASSRVGLTRCPLASRVQKNQKNWAYRGDCNGYDQRHSCANGAIVPVSDSSSHSPAFHCAAAQRGNGADACRDGGAGVWAGPCGGPSANEIRIGNTCPIPVRRPPMA